MLFTTRRAFLGGLAAFPCLAAPSLARQTKIALVIGNADYAHNDSLKFACTDADAVAYELGVLGFEVEPHTRNLGSDALRRVVRDFGEKIRQSGSDVVTFVYYNGHAAEDGDHVNYLLPIDATTDTPQRVREFGTPLQPLLADMQTADNDVNILVLDACRDWFAGDTSRAGRGLADMGVHASVLISYAVGPGYKADVPADSKSSPYSAQLIRALKSEPSLPVAQLFDDVQSAAYNDSQSDQTPLYLNGLARARRWTLTSGGLSPRQAIERLPAGRRMGFILSEADRPALLDFSKGAISFVDALLGRLDILAANEINNADRIAFFSGSIAHETGAFHSQIERFKYGPVGLMKNWPRAFPTLEIANLYVGKPEASANRAYASIDGNGDESSGDGWRYRGRGLFMLTRKNWYRHFSTAQIDLVADPELVNDPQIGLDVAAKLWRERGANELADRRDLDRIMAHMWFREHVKERYWWIRRAYGAINAKIPDGIGVSENRAA